MLEQLKYLKVPTYIACGIIALLVILQIIGTILDVKGKATPEIMNIKKWFIRKKEERKARKEFPTMVKELKSLVADFNSHYNPESIQERNDWMRDVNKHIKDSEPLMQNIKDILEQHSDVLLEINIEQMRSAIINFAEKVADDNYPATQKQFNRILNLHARYEKVLEDNNKTNGETAIAFPIIQDAYKVRLKNHSFIENIRGYDAE